jgi:hypothetical protein
MNRGKQPIETKMAPPTEFRTPKYPTIAEAKRLIKNFKESGSSKESQLQGVI